MKQKKEYFDPPPEGWVWDGDWFKHPEHGLACNVGYNAAVNCYCAIHVQ